MEWGIGSSARWVRGGAVIVVGLLVGCVEAPREEDEVIPPPTSAGSMTAAGTGNAMGTTDGPTASGPSTTTGATADSSSSGEIKLDVGGFDTTNVTAGDTEQGMGCDKVDFLFIIDNSGSMGDEQDNLIASFPGFIETIQTTIDDAQDYHLMVIDSDAWVYEGCQNNCDSACIPPSGVCPFPPAFECFLPCTLQISCAGQFQCGVTTPFECEDVLGAGVTHPRGSQASNQDCNFSSGARYMDSSEPDLASAFSCAADVGIGSTAGTERPMEAMVQAVTPSTDAFACNEGFIRDDAILVVTFITDENDSSGDSAGTVEGWRQALISAKQGDESAVVVLGLFGDQDEPGAICEELTEDSTDGAEPAPRLREFVNSWGPNGFAGSVCAPTYESFFAEAVGIIDTTCEEFIPPAG